MAENENKALAMVNHQYGLPIEEVKKLIVIPSDMRPADQTIIDAVNVARSIMVPLWGINLIKSKQGVKVYINAEGIAFAVANDPRGVQSDEFVLIQQATKENPVALVRRVITMKTGEVYHGLGAAQTDSQWNEANTDLKADTKAGRRAGYKAIAARIGLPMYDEDNPNLNPKPEYRGPTAVIQFLTEVGDEEFERVFNRKIDQGLSDDEIPEMWQKILESRKPTR